MKKIKISQVDVLFASGLYPIEFLFYYRERFNTKGVRSALKKPSSGFWPVFGEYKNGLIVYDKYKEEDFLPKKSKTRSLTSRRWQNPDTTPILAFACLILKNCSF